MRKLFLILMTLMACSWSLTAQTSHTYHGTVVDRANNEPLIGATIMPVGGGHGVATDAEGKFTLRAPATVTKVRITYVGYKEQTVTLQSNMQIYLTATSSNLDDVVVVAYGTANKESLTGSVAVVGSKEIEDRPVTTVTAALEGNAPGVQVNNSTGTPGSAPSIRIRGFSSINGVNSPLYVVDGIPFEGSINDINPADIESMSVLKDAASSALYGNRGANGVILINTKRAKTAGKVDVTLQVRQGFNNRSLPFYDRLDANQWMQTQFTSQVNGDTRYYDIYAPYLGYTRQDHLDYYRSGAFIEDFAQNNIYGVADDKLFDENGTFIGGNPLPGYTDLDWWKAIAHTGYRQEYNVNASGATDKFNIFASFGYLKENGYVIGTDFDRFNGRLNANFTPTSYLRMGINLAATQQESETGQADADNLSAINNPFLTQSTAPIYPYYLHNEDGSIVYDEKTGEPVWNTEGYNEGTNVAWEQRLNQNSYNKTAIDGSAYITVVIPYGFELTLRGQLFRSKQNILEYNNNTVGSQAGSGMLSREFDDNRSHTFMQQLTWSHDYGMNHVDVLLDHENYNVSSKYDFIRKTEQQIPDHLDLNNFAVLDYGTAGYSQLRTESYLGRARYNYAQKYFAEASIRRDGSSRFHKDNRWGTFWSVGASWVISKEKFMQSLNWVNFLKLRAAYGSVGNDQSAPVYASYNYYGWDSYDGGKVATLVPAFLGTRQLKWESTKTLDVALEGSLFNDRLNFSIGYFNKRNTDLLFRTTLPNSVGTLGTGANPTIWRNIATMQNIGWELQFGVNIIRNKDVKWDFNIDATFLKNKIVKLPDGKNLPSQGLFQGKSLYEHMEFDFAGVDQLTGQSVYTIDPQSPDFMYYDNDGAMQYNEDTFNSYVNAAKADAAAGASVFIEKDGKYYTSNTSYATRKICGTSLPTVYGSFGTNFSWKGINLGLLFTYSLGGKTYDSNYQGLMSASTIARALHKDILNSWTAAPEGMTEDSPNRIDPNGIPQLNSQFSSYNNASSSRWLTSSSYLTLKNVNLSYDFPSKWVRAMKMQNLNLGVSIDNVFIVAKRKGMNPTYGFAGGQGEYYVPTRTVSFQLSVKF